MSRRLPSLTALRAFEAAARHLSFTKAGEELHVTQAAISNQVKSLEEYCGRPLFRRQARALVLTEAAQRSLPSLRQGFDKLAEAAEHLMTLDTGDFVTVSSLVIFAAKWLVPRLENFYHDHPGIDVRIEAAMRNVDLSRDDVDIYIHLGGGDYPGMIADKLMSLEVFPVCSPRLLEGPKPLRVPADLRHHTLLHVDFFAPWPDWSEWLEAAGTEGVDVAHGPRFNGFGMQLQAAVRGLGVALASSLNIADDLEAGRLVKPFDLAIDANLDMYVICQESAVERPQIAAFRDWILAEAAADVPPQPEPALAGRRR